MKSISLSLAAVLLASASQSSAQSLPPLGQSED